MKKIKEAFNYTNKKKEIKIFFQKKKDLRKKKVLRRKLTLPFLGPFLEKAVVLEKWANLKPVNIFE